MKTALPWILVLALIAGIYFVYADGQKKTAEIARLTQETQGADVLRAENETLKKSAVQSRDSADVQKEHEDLLRLRSEVQALKRQANELNGKLGAAQAQGARAQETQQQLTQIAAENQTLRDQTQRIAQAQAQTQAITDPAKAQDACINILRQIDGAKQQWALENRKLPTDTPQASDISPYLAGNKIPPCPSGGTIVIGNLQTAPTCSIAGHALQ